MQIVHNLVKILGKCPPSKINIDRGSNYKGWSFMWGITLFYIGKGKRHIHQLGLSIGKVVTALKRTIREVDQNSNIVTI